MTDHREFSQKHKDGLAIRMEQFLNRHLLLAYVLAVVGIPVCILTVVAVGTLMVMFPVSLCMGWI